MAAMRPLASLLALAALIVLAPAPLSAQIYRWVDEAGTPHYAQGLDTVPERYRAGATRVGLRTTLPATDPAPGQDTRPAAGAIHYVPGRPIMADVRINGSTPARLVLDTGADRTLISPRALAAAGVSTSRAVGRGRIVGVTGSDLIPYVLVDSIEVAGLSVARLTVGAYDVAGLDGDGLLGRDVLDQFHVAIDSARGVVTLSPR